MGCNPYADFGIGLTDAYGLPLPACPSAPIDAPPQPIRTEADFVQEVCNGPRADLERAEMRRDQKQTDERAALQYRGAAQGSESQEY